jgi:hypothetical protein
LGSFTLAVKFHTIPMPSEVLMETAHGARTIATFKVAVEQDRL